MSDVEPTPPPTPSTEPDEAVEANVEELYGKGDERAGVATMPAEERDRLLGDDAPAAPKPAGGDEAVEAQPGDTAEEGTDVPASDEADTGTATDEPA